MSLRNNSSDLHIKIIETTKEIVKLINFGINIPILPEFHKYIIKDFKFYNAKSIIIMCDSEVVGHSLLFDDKKGILYFGYFGVKDDDLEIINVLAHEIINYAEKNKFEFIRGPINIPTFIFGWGFMRKGSDDSLFLGKPVNSPSYNHCFQKLGFYIKFEEVTWEGNMKKINPWNLSRYNFKDYEFKIPEKLRDLYPIKNDIIKLYSENIPDSAIITPNLFHLIISYIDFMISYGDLYMFFYVRYSPTDEIIAFGTCIPNIFSKDEKGRYNSLVYYIWSVKPEHRRNGIGILMYGATSLKAWERGYRYISGSIGRENLANAGLAQSLGVSETRSHLILEYKM